ncbi:MAG: VWA domain-containing protein, partial [Acidobacteria bacterium]|nr:VWA domain-containing protein [Acidobacteriota bacterium]
MRKALFLLAIALLTISTFAQETTQGTLYAVTKKGSDLGACPLKNTAVRADISGFLVRVNVKQEFENSFAEPIEAVYTFPLSQNGAVDDMTMTIGSRTVRGKIMKREEARATYEAAKAAGQAASLLDQERPNIFTQAVANIMPGEKVVIEISYVETLKYEDGAYEFVFPMTVGPRYIPASVKDAARIRPPVIARTRAGHDVSVEVNLNAGVPIEAVRSTSHRIDQLNLASSKAKVTLRGERVIPNKDFILRYDVTGKRLQDGVLAHRDARGGFFSLVLQPPDAVAPEDRTPKEIVFVLDTSGSMDGFPIEKAKEAMKLSLDGLYPEDTFNLITFAGDTDVLFEKPVPATQANLERAQAFLDGREGGGGTEMMKAIRAALEPSDSQEHLRIVCFMTDAFVGNDDEIISAIQKHPKARVFSFGIGDSVNRSLLDKMAEAGNGEVEIVTLEDDGSKTAKRFYERVRTPMLTDISIDWNGLPVADVYPNKIGDLFSAKPVIVNARYTKGASGTIKLKGNVAGQPYERTIKVELPETESANDVLATLWARRRVDELSMDALKGGPNAEAANKQIEGLGLEYRILTSFTSFVAVEEKVINSNGTPTKVEVPVTIPEGVNINTAGGGDTDQVNQGDLADQAPDPKVAKLSDPSLTLPTPSTRGPYRAKRRSPQLGDPNAKVGSLSNGPGTGMGSGTGSGRGTGMGSGSGSGSGSGDGNGTGGGGGGGSVMATVNVAAESVTVDVSSSTVSSTISSRQVQALPSGTSFSSLLRLSPGLVSNRRAGGFQIDGASGSENTFEIDSREVRAAGDEEESTFIGRAVAIAEPVYPTAARAKRALGKVVVEVRTDLSGTIVSARAISGSSHLRKAAESAAMLSKFAPAFARGRGVKVSGSIVYDFKSRGKVI